MFRNNDENALPPPVHNGGNKKESEAAEKNQKRVRNYMYTPGAQQRHNQQRARLVMQRLNKNDDGGDDDAQRRRRRRANAIKLKQQQADERRRANRRPQQRQVPRTTMRQKVSGAQSQRSRAARALVTPAGTSRITSRRRENDALPSSQSNGSAAGRVLMFGGGGESKQARALKAIGHRDDPGQCHTPEAKAATVGGGGGEEFFEVPNDFDFLGDTPRKAFERRQRQRARASNMQLHDVMAFYHQVGEHLRAGNHVGAECSLDALHERYGEEIEVRADYWIQRVLVAASRGNFAAALDLIDDALDVGASPIDDLEASANTLRQSVEVKRQPLLVAAVDRLLERIDTHLMANSDCEAAPKQVEQQQQQELKTPTKAKRHEEEKAMKTPDAQTLRERAKRVFSKQHEAVVSSSVEKAPDAVQVPILTALMCSALTEKQLAEQRRIDMLAPPPTPPSSPSRKSMPQPSNTTPSIAAARMRRQAAPSSPFLASQPARRVLLSKEEETKENGEEEKEEEEEQVYDDFVIDDAPLFQEEEQVAEEEKEEEEEEKEEEEEEEEEDDDDDDDVTVSKHLAQLFKPQVTYGRYDTLVAVRTPKRSAAKNQTRLLSTPVLTGTNKTAVGIFALGNDDNDDDLADTNFVAVTPVRRSARLNSRRRPTLQLPETMTSIVVVEQNRLTRK
jgi:hypothetical protein